VTSDESGYICALLPSKDLWRININNLSLAKVPVFIVEKGTEIPLISSLGN